MSAATAGSAGAGRAGAATAGAGSGANGAARGEEPPGDVRLHVRELLGRTASFAQLGAEERRQIAGALVKVIAFLRDQGADAPDLAGGAPVQALDIGENESLKSRLSDDPRLVGADFKAGAAREGAQVFKSLVSAVDFPKFVSGLIEGVHSSIVASSIKQMQAYGKLLEAVAKTAEEFAQENVSLDTARKFVASSFPQAVVYDNSSPGGGALRLGDDVEEGDAPDFKAKLGMSENVALDEENELKIVMAAQLKLARQRQQQLALMLALGINRIIVTDGEIKASVMFDVKSHDDASRRSQASTYDTSAMTREEGGGWFDDASQVETKVSSAWSEESEKSSSTLDAKAKLSGSVTVRFRSETFPLERLASGDEIGAVQEKGNRGGAPATRP
ncbi:MAG TPA: hypothetical protein VKB80_27455 [Kofleriaceae bacterium]|nr:hypothetical protein [Kofleriaceae bacterium]